MTTLQHADTPRWNWPAGGVLAAIAITTAMDANGLFMYSALALTPLAGLFWYLQRFSGQEMGMGWGTARANGWALAFPVIAMATIALVAMLAGATDTTDANWKTAGLNIAVGSTIGVLMVWLTEEGFFRGWLWASLKNVGHSNLATLWLSTAAFVIWHLSAILLDTGFDVPLREVPIYLVNATIIGGVFGYLRLVSGSVFTASVCHAVWNALAYPLFGFGEKTGELGIAATHIYGPEVGVVGIAVNSLLAVLMIAAMPIDRDR
ncbi:MAG: CPBP family intramembrane glutamic endopeptidase [Pseudomonadota bacterium]